MHCDDCGTRLERNGVCPNCDEEAFILDTQEKDRPTTEGFLELARKGHQRAANRLEGEK